LAGVVDELSAPLVAWGVTDRGGKTFNTAILWEQEVGPVDLYDKRHPVPFGEYVPDRAFWRPFAPQLIDLIQRDYTPGSTDPIFDVNGIPVGVTICFDIVDDALLSQAAQLGAQVLVASSNNADFGRTDESKQQLAIARSRALELGRSVVNVSTVGITAAIAPDGRIIERLPWFAAGAMVADVPLATTFTPAAIAGIPLGWAISLFGPLSLLAFMPARASRRSVSNQHTRK
jgi:apolipoprotein N-acyltransferase